MVGTSMDVCLKVIVDNLDNLG
ncbi:hypothetical protein XBP1_1080010 [Xenorhabdus bovienii str. puntauvense]|uniref:Uncharacterized protein n=1 Tax=Xenorhabdus bovienii str. puntauvense TaxID=1398201 RepID=A0A077NAB0_XENBV|nr:hypothetical protein XBFFR1_1560004 [Xenorhabdus bovienii str. feltiae France]CDG94504.1 hypothetical protein XBFFL1_740004 [Xenorhabdus bovienii str. feltiae Florida]CDG95147.1 hypothetical protein XBP1_1080010 [Xenorhabdus bovienii str. puntauvense]